MEVALATASEKQVWTDKYLLEYLRRSGYMPFMGRSSNSIIQARYELNEEAGKTINIPLITRLVGQGVTGSQTLDGAEEELTNYNCAISIDWRRNAVRVPKSTSYKTEIDLFDAAREALKNWEAEKLRDDISRAMLSVVTTGDTTVAMASASTANRNAYSAANSDRLLFGASTANYSATFATALGNCDTTNDKLTTATASLGRRMARAANPHIRPYQVDDGREFYVAFCGARSFRDLKLDTAMVSANRDARAREGSGYMNNPLFRDGDLWYDGILYREVPEIDDICAETGVGLNGAGASSADVRPVFLAGVQAIGIAWGQEPTPRTDTKKDFEFRPGVAIEELLGVKKMAYNGKQHGLVTIFVAAAADA